MYPKFEIVPKGEKYSLSNTSRLQNIEFVDELRHKQTFKEHILLFLRHLSETFWKSGRDGKSRLSYSYSVGETLIE